jgi:hypothetical protein
VDEMPPTMAVYIVPFFVATLLAVLYQVRLLRFDNTFYAVALMGLGLFAGTRFETGPDWPGYEDYFDAIDLSDNPFGYIFSVEHLQFEPGFYLLNYAIKYLHGSYSVVFLLASLFCAFAVYRFTKRFAGNKFYILTIYVGYSFLILHFAQVRQSIAIAFFLLGCTYYLEHGRKLPALAIASVGPFFQYSSVVYILLLLVVWYWHDGRKWNLLWKASFIIFCIPVVYLAMHFFEDFYTVVALVSTFSAQEKIAIYKETQEEHGPALFVYAAYLLFLAGYFGWYGRGVGTQEQSFIMKFAIASLLVTTALVFVFPGSYVMYSRGYVLACIFQAYATSLIFASRRELVHGLVFVATIAIALTYYFRVLLPYADDYVPYRSIVGLH